jgi:hypothetical protein
MASFITEHRYPCLAAQEACGSRAYHGWMKSAGFNASWRAAKAESKGDTLRAEREQASRTALVPYPWTGIYKAFSIT